MHISKSNQICCCSWSDLFRIRQQYCFFSLCYAQSSWLHWHWINNTGSLWWCSCSFLHMTDWTTQCKQKVLQLLLATNPSLRGKCVLLFIDSEVNIHWSVHCKLWKNNLIHKYNTELWQATLEHGCAWMVGKIMLVFYEHLRNCSVEPINFPRGTKVYKIQIKSTVFCRKARSNIPSQRFCFLIG